MKARILNVQRFCTKDGPGIRTTVFFKGCPLRCLWCHNPESQTVEPELLYQAEKCVHCLHCVSLCPTHCHTVQDGVHLYARTPCVGCGRCLNVGCHALELAGEERAVEDLLQTVLRDLPYYRNSGGGLTLSGGEPLMQAEAALALLHGAHAAGVHTAVETCGFVSRATLAQTLPVTDLYLYDYKESDPVRHREYTGVGNDEILENLFYLDAMQKKTVLRCPIIPGLNDRPDHLEGIATLAGRLAHLCEIVIEPYHTLGVGKYARLGRIYALPDTEPLARGAADRFVQALQSRVAVPVVRA